MKINAVSSVNSFRGKLMFNSDIPSNGFKSLSKEEIAQEYDKQIAIIQSGKKKAMELDEFMHSDKVTSLIDKLLEEDQIDIASLLSTEDSVDEGSMIKPEKFELFYYADTVEREIEAEKQSLDYIEAQNDDGSINKEGILNWL